VASILLLGVVMGGAAIGLVLEGGPAFLWLANAIFFFAGVCIGSAVAFYGTARERDEELRLEATRMAQTLVDKEHFGGFRRHE